MTPPARLARALPLLAAVVALLPDAGAAFPSMTYWFRDFTVTFYPLRVFAAREIAAGRFPWWNPYVNEGAFVLPILYPVDLLHAAFPGPVAVSWLLTLHLPLAALAAYALARDLGGSPPAAFASGVVFATGGLAVSSLNLYVFLQALALAPLLALALRRAALRGGRWTAAAAFALALSLSTLAVEFVVQAVAMGLVLAWADRAARSGAGRIAVACGVGAALAAVPLLTVAAVLPDTVRGAGFARDVALGNELHPAALLQAVLPRLFGDPAMPVEAWWGGRFFTKGFPYFLTLYLGPPALALAVVGAVVTPPRRRAALIGLSLLALWYAMGARAGLAAALADVPGLDFFRFPSKAFLGPYLAGALLAGAGLEALVVGRGWKVLAAASAPLCLAGIATALAAERVARIVVGSAASTVPMPTVVGTLSMDGLRLALLAGGAVVLAAAVGRRLLAPDAAAAIVATAMAADLATAAHGVNPQAPAAFYRPLPEVAALRLDQLDGGRVFTYGLDQSPAFRNFLAGGGGRALWSFFLSRQTLAPYANIIDAVEIAEGKDLTGFIPQAPAFTPEDLAPGRIAAILPRLRDAAVSRIVSLDALAHPDLAEIARADAGPPGLAIHVYAVRGPWPRAHVDCGEGCAGRVRRRARPGEIALDVEAPAAGLVVVRDNAARGWRAEVDGRSVPVLRAGRHMAVRVEPGTRSVTLRYHPPGLSLALVLTACGALAAAALLVRARR